MKDLLLNVGSGGGAAAAAPAAGGAAGGDAAVAEKEEEKKEEGTFIIYLPLRQSNLMRREGGIRRRHGLWSLRLIASSHAQFSFLHSASAGAVGVHHAFIGLEESSHALTRCC